MEQMNRLYLRKHFLVGVAVISSFISTPVLAETTNLGTAETGLADITLADLQSLDGASRIYELIYSKVEAQIDKDASAAEDQQQPLTEKNDQPQNWFAKEFNKTKIEFQIDLPEINLGHLKISVKGHRSVNQTKAGEQRRLDRLEVEVRLASTAYIKARFRLNSAKYFMQEDMSKDSKHSLKYIALFSKPIRAIPRSASSIVSAMNIRESLGIEIDGLFGLEYGKDENVNGRRSNIGVNAKRGATFAIDVSRASQDIFNVRLMGLKNKGELTVSGNAYVSFLPNAISVLSRAFSVGGSLSINTTDRIINRYPVESILVAYSLNVSQDKGREALDSMVQAIRRMDFLPLFTVGLEDDKLSDALLQKLTTIENTAELDLLSKTRTPSVRRLVRAKMITQNFKSGLEIQGTKLYNRSFARGGSKTYIRYFNPLTKVTKPYVLWNEYYNEDEQMNIGSAAVRENKFEHVSFDFLAHADENKNPTATIGIVSSLEGREAKLSFGEADALRSRILRMIPTNLRNNAELLALLPKEQQDSVTYRIDSIITNDGLAAISRIPEANIHQGLIDFANANKIDEKLIGGKYGSDGVPALHEVTGPMARSIVRLSSGVSDSLASNFTEFSKHESFVRKIGPNFLPSLLPADQDINKLAAVNVEFNSSTAAGRKTLGSTNSRNEAKIGEDSEVEVYKILGRLRTLLTDRGFEERIVDDFEDITLNSQSGKVQKQ